MAEALRLTQVVAAVILHDSRVLICQRRAEQPFPLQWEFPGGKVEAGEALDMALRRELHEELGIEAIIDEEMATVRHQYAEGLGVELHFFAVHNFTGELKNKIFHEVRWEELVTAQAKAGSHAKEEWQQQAAGQLAAQSAGHNRHERAVGAGHQGARKLDAFRLVGIQQFLVSAALCHLRQLPAEIDGIADSGVHSLSANRAVYVSGITEKEGAANAEVLGHAMMHAIAGEPVHLGDFDIEDGLDVRAKVIEVQVTPSL